MEHLPPEERPVVDESIEAFRQTVSGAWRDHREHILSQGGELEWRYTAASEGIRLGVAFVSLTLPKYVEEFGEGCQLVLVRQSEVDVPEPNVPEYDDLKVLIYTDKEWDAFIAGAKDGEFDID